MREENSQLKVELAAKDKLINDLQKQLEEKENAIATLQTEFNNRLAEAAKTETFLSEELQRFKYGIVPGEEPHGEQLQLFPTPEELPPEEPEEQAAVIPKRKSKNTKSPAVKSQPLTVNSKPSSGTTKPKLLTPGELAKWINETHNPEKPIKDYNIRDWFKKGSTCSDKKRAEVQEKYGFKFSHQDKKGTLWFTVG